MVKVKKIRNRNNTNDDPKKYLKTAKFERVKKAVFKRDGNKCVICGRKDGLLVCHHTNYKHYGQGDELEIADCITLCQKDHLVHHSAKCNMAWYSRNHPRNRTDLKLLKVDGFEILVGESGEEFYDARAYTKFKIYKNKKRGNRKTIQIEGKHYYCNRLVAKAFPEICGEWFDGCEVHHKDRNKENDSASNLLVVSISEHKELHKDETQKLLSDVNSVPVYQYSMSGDFIAEYKNSFEASIAVGVCESAIRNVTCGISDSSGGYRWLTTYTDRLDTPLEEPIERVRKANQIAISQYTLDGEWVRDWSCLKEATDYFGGKSTSSINNVIKGRSKTAFGYKWEHKKNNTENIEENVSNTGDKQD